MYTRSMNIIIDIVTHIQIATVSGGITIETLISRHISVKLPLKSYADFTSGSPRNKFLMVSSTVYRDCLEESA
ncbi:hypothetical protein Hanom_Chr13g01233871 [Helianthus anomalus]